ncbi:MAG: hypothetical protein KGQ67_06700 [Betaproteobacteria bacterium]|nr:hypothetical protein [Betaproteobacteria bacterium]
MKDSKTARPATQPTALAVLAHLLERLERSPTPIDPHQYRDVVARLSVAMLAEPDPAALEAVLARLPAAAELWENLQYAHAGLCRQRLDSALAAESRARQVIAAARRQTAG